MQTLIMNQTCPILTARIIQKFLIKEAMPAVASRYRVAVGPENTGVGGFVLRRDGGPFHCDAQSGHFWAIDAGEYTDLYGEIRCLERG